MMTLSPTGWLQKQNSTDRSGLLMVIYLKMYKHLNKYVSNEDISLWQVKERPSPTSRVNMIE